jgi:hypothetical protein
LVASMRNNICINAGDLGVMEAYPVTKMAVLMKGMTYLQQIFLTCSGSLLAALNTQAPTGCMLNVIQTGA